MLSENKWLQYGKEGLDVQGIVIHNTANPEMSAQELFDYLNNECKLSTGTHYFVDHKGIIEVMPLTWKTYTTGKGEDWCFKHCIAIEICDNYNDDLYQKGQINANKLIKALLKKYKLTEYDIYFHHDFNERFYCPHVLLDKYGNVKSYVMNEIRED